MVYQILNGPGDTMDKNNTQIENNETKIDVKMPLEKDKSQNNINVSVEEEIGRAGDGSDDGSGSGSGNGLDRSKPPVPDEAIMKEYLGKMLKDELQKVITDRRDVQKYQQGEVQGFLTPELLEAMIASSMEKMMDKYDDHLQEKVDQLNKLVDKISEHQKTESVPTKIDERLQKIEKILQKESDFPYNDLIQRMKTSISADICKMCKLYKASLNRICHLFPNFLYSLMGKYLDNQIRNWY